jgi:hypothetical protein
MHSENNLAKEDCPSYLSANETKTAACSILSWAGIQCSKNINLLPLIGILY